MVLFLSLTSWVNPLIDKTIFLLVLFLIIKDIFSKQKEVEYERCYLEKMWDFSINFLMSYNILDPDYQKSLEINEKIYLELVENFEKEWIEFAFPSQTIYVKE